VRGNAPPRHDQSFFGVSAAVGELVGERGLQAAIRVYLGVEGYLFAVDAKSGHKRWKTSTGTPPDLVG
jgi:outer membrane protein assembly factor BamB